MELKIKKKLLLEAVAIKSSEDDRPGAMGAVGVGALGAVGAAKLGGAAKAALGAKTLGLMAGKGSGLYIDPMEPSRTTAALYSGLGSAAITAEIGGLEDAFGSGGIPAGAIGIGAAGAGVTGAALGAAMVGGKDTIARSVLLPAAVAGASSVAMNHVFDATGYPNIESSPVESTLTTGGLMGGTYYLRNHNKKMKFI